uniref:Uncharacterized protein n=1 Tax=Gossypium raimondii TaxID=29730 RepID=A0A0D2PWB2_GOSRA|nr:hypothetical protein B456_001G244400 [Gossypium raimondii]
MPTWQHLRRTSNVENRPEPDRDTARRISSNNDSSHGMVNGPTLLKPYSSSVCTRSFLNMGWLRRNIRRRMSVIVVVGRYPGIPSPLLQHLSDPNYLTNFLAFSHSVIHSFPKKVTENEQGTLKGKVNTFRECERKRKGEVEEGSFRWREKK